MTKDVRNNLLKRREVNIIIESESNPGFEKALTMLSEQFKVDKNNIALKNIKSKFGRNTFLLDANLYDSAADKQRIEPKPKITAKKEGAQ